MRRGAAVGSTLLLVLLGVAATVGPSQGADPFFYPFTRDQATGLTPGPSAYTSANRCAYCHPDQHEQWRGSMHALAFTDPLFQGVWRVAAEELGGAVAKRCTGCHTPVGSAAEIAWVRAGGEVVIDEIAREGVTCDFCHSIQEVRILEPGGDPAQAGLVVVAGGAKRGPYADAFSTFHETAYSELHTRSEFCGACHNVYHLPPGLDLGRTYTEWRASVYAEKEIQCQDCHMVPPETAAAVARDLTKPALSGSTSTFGTERIPYFFHRFTGSNAAVPQWFGHAVHVREVEQRLRSAARLTLKLPDQGRAGSELEIGVTVENVGAGHNLPTGISELREMWLQLEVSTAAPSGTVLYSSGRLDAAGALAGDVRRFGLQFADRDGQPVWYPWKIDRLVEDRSIPARGSRTEEFRVRLPPAVSGPLQVSARLLFRSFPPGEVVAVQAPVPLRATDIPVVEMAVVSGTVTLASDSDAPRP